MASEKEAALTPATFDRIIKKENSSTVIYEDDEVFAFRDMAPEAPPHIVIIPKVRDGLTGLSKAQTPMFSTQVGLDDTTFDEAQQPIQKKQRVRFTQDEDKLLIQAWLSVPKNAVVGLNQKADSLWLRIRDNYNEGRGHLKARGRTQIKSRWHKLNKLVRKFARSYKLAYNRKKSGSTETDIMIDAYKIYYQDVGEHFKLEYAWRLLKDEAKWSSEGANNKRTRIDVSGVYSSSSNLDTPSSCEYNATSPTVVRPMGTEVAIRKGKSKLNETSFPIVELTEMNATSPTVDCPMETEVAIRKEKSNSNETSYPIVELTEVNAISPTVVHPLATEAATRKEKSKPDETTWHNVELTEVQERPKSEVHVMAELARAQDEQNRLKEKELEIKERELKMKEREFELEILFKDTSIMIDRQLRDHEMLCNIIREKHGIM